MKAQQRILHQRLVCNQRRGRTRQPFLSKMLFIFVVGFCQTRTVFYLPVLLTEKDMMTCVAY